MTEYFRKRDTKLLQWAAASLGFLALGITLWLPFFRQTGLIEEWRAYAQFDRGASFISTGDNNDQPNRPFTLLGFAIGYFIAHDSFIGLNLLNFVLFIGKALLVYAIIQQIIPKNLILAFACAILFVIYPADTATLSIRTTNYHVSVFFYLLSTYLLLIYWKSPRPITLVAIWITQIVCLGCVETSLPLFFATPLLLLWINKKASSHLVRTTLYWYFVPIFFSIWTAIVLIQGGNYQNRLLSLNNPMSTQERLAGYIYFFARAYYWNFVGSWTDLLSNLSSNWSLVIIVLLIGCVTGILLYSQTGLDNTTRKQRSDSRKYAQLAFIGLAILGLGYIAFLPLPHRALTERIYLFSSLGSALSIVTLLFLLSAFTKYPKLTFTVAVSILMSLATVGALNQHQKMFEYSLNEQHILAQFAAQMPTVKQQTLIILFDPIHKLQNDEWTFAINEYSDAFADALRYLYQAPAINAVVCYPGQTWGYKNELCELQENQVVLKQAQQVIGIYPYNKVIAFEVDQFGNIVLLKHLPEQFVQNVTPDYNPDKLIDFTSPPPQRVHTLLISWPFSGP